MSTERIETLVSQCLTRAGIPNSVEQPGAIYLPGQTPDQQWVFGIANNTWGGDLITGDYDLVRQHDLGIPVTHRSDGNDIAEAIIRTLAVDALRHTGIDHAVPIPAPWFILDAIAVVEAERLSGAAWVDMDQMKRQREITQQRELITYSAYFPRYSTCSCGYGGPVVVILWEADPGALVSFTFSNGKWDFCNQSHW